MERVRNLTGHIGFMLSFSKFIHFVGKEQMLQDVRYMYRGSCTTLFVMAARQRAFEHGYNSLQCDTHRFPIYSQNTNIVNCFSIRIAFCLCSLTTHVSSHIIGISCHIGPTPTPCRSHASQNYIDPHHYLRPHLPSLHHTCSEKQGIRNRNEC